MHALFRAAAIAALALPLLAQAPAPTTSARTLVAAWRHALHLSHASGTAHVHYSLSEDGLTGTRDEWLTQSGLYRNATDRQYDTGAYLITPQGVTRRDWDGYVRTIDREEGGRVRTEAVIAQVLAFGPPSAMNNATVGETADHSAWTLAYTAPGAGVITWTLNRATGLPQKAVVHDEDARDITYTYTDWQNGAPRTITQSTANSSSTLTLTAAPAYARIAPADFAALTAGPADLIMTSDTVDVPFIMAANHIILPVGVNGHEPIGFIFDTGDDSELINTARMAELGVASYGSSHLTGGGAAQQSAYCRDIDFAIGGATLHHQHATVLDLSGLERIFGVKLGGILGYDFIARFVVDIDYEHKIMHLRRPNTSVYDGRGYLIPITFDNGIPYAEGSIAVPTKPNIAAHFLLDFGASDTMILTRPFVQANDLLNLASTSRAVNTTPGAQQFYTQNNSRGRIDELHLGQAVQRGIPVSFSANTSGAYASPSFAGTIGEGIYTRYRAILDYSNRTLILEPTLKTDEPFHERVAFGLTPLMSEDLSAVTVSAVTANSPAATAGFQAHDVITSLDRQTHFMMEDLRTVLATGGHHVFVVARGGQSVTISADIPAPH